MMRKLRRILRRFTWISFVDHLSRHGMIWFRKATLLWCGGAITVPARAGGGIGWKAATGFGGFPDHPVQAFDGVGGVDDLAHRWREGKERDDLLPCSPPAWGD